MTPEAVIANALADADKIVEDQIRACVATMLAVDGDADLDAIDDQIAAVRDAWATQRAALPDVITKALAARAAAGPRS
jgi:DNA-binding FrmR family transcriptional regulator